MDDYVTKMSERLRFAYSKIRQELQNSREKQQKEYNKRAQQNKYKVSDMVLLEKRVVDKHEAHKFAKTFSGPWRIILVYPGTNTVDIADNSYVPKG